MMEKIEKYFIKCGNCERTRIQISKKLMRFLLSHDEQIELFEGKSRVKVVKVFALTGITLNQRRKDRLIHTPSELKEIKANRTVKP